jgi:hypothetical protein
VWIRVSRTAIKRDVTVGDVKMRHAPFAIVRAREKSEGLDSTPEQPSKPIGSTSPATANSVLHRANLAGIVDLDRVAVLRSKLELCYFLA